MMMKCSVLSALLLACLLPNVARALIGEPAPAFDVAGWAKGGPVEIKAGTNILVVEIWQSSSRSARSSVKVFSDIQRRFQSNGVVLVGICDEPLEKLKAFVEAHDTNIAYAVAADNNHHTSRSYMTLAAQRALPYAFIVGTNGTVLWHGWSPYDLEQSLAQIVAGGFDLPRAKEIETATHQMQQYMDLLRQGDRRAAISGRTLLANRTNNVVLLCDLAMEIVSMPPNMKRDFALADAALTQAEAIQTTNADRVAFVRAMWLFESGQQEAGIARATQALAAAKNPQDKSIIEAGLRRMRERLAAQGRQKLAQPVQSTNAAAPTLVPGGAAPAAVSKP